MNQFGESKQKNSWIDNCLDSRKFDTRKFKTTKKEIRSLCLSFKLGRLISFAKEKNIRLSHSNFIVMAKTARGDFIFKYYSKESSVMIIKEFLLSKFLREHGFATPQMLACNTKQPFTSTRSYLVACYSFINGKPFYLTNTINNDNIISVNRMILELKCMLALSSDNKKIGYVLKKERLSTVAQSLLSLRLKVKKLPNNTTRRMLSSWISDAHHNYRSCAKYLKKQVIHANISPSNILLTNKQAYCLDLGHVKNDFELNDLANFVVSCMLLKMKPPIIQKFVSLHFSSNDIPLYKSGVLNLFIKLHLIKEYIKTLEQEHKWSGYHHRNLFLSHYRSEIINYKNLIKKSLLAIAVKPEEIFSYV